MSILGSLKPRFWEQRVGEGPFKSLFNYRRIWQFAALLIILVALGPLLTMAILDYNMTKDAVESETEERVSRLVSNTKRTVSYFLEERTAALSYVARSNDFADLASREKLAGVLSHLTSSFGGFVDLGLINAKGRQVAYVGPFELAGKDYSGQEWFRSVMRDGEHISDVFRGFRDVPHMTVAVRGRRPDGTFHVVRATLDIERFKDILTSLDLTAGGDAFLINRDGTLQTPSRRGRDALETSTLPVPRYNETTTVFETELDGEQLMVGYAYIPNSPFILMIVKSKDELMQAWYESRIDLVGFLGISVMLIILVIVGVATYLVDKIYTADQRRATALHHMEHSNKMASIGRLAAGVAHEINNPLAVINEKAGLIKDLFTYKSDCKCDPRLSGLLDQIISSVERCGTITKRLLSFARHLEVSWEPVNVKKVIEEVLSFLDKEADYRSIQVDLSAADQLPMIVSDRGKLQQIFLNLLNNAFQAMDEGGRLEIEIFRENEEEIAIKVHDDGCGIPKEDLKRIFEPFFSTRKKRGGTGLGLSITYGLVRELSGRMEVDSELGAGTTFAVLLPLEGKKEQHK